MKKNDLLHLRDNLETEISKIKNFNFKRSYQVTDMVYLQPASVHKIVDGRFVGNSVWEDQTMDVITLAPSEIDLDSLIFLYSETL
jgi:hypothetical protein